MTKNIFSSKKYFFFGISAIAIIIVGLFVVLEKNHISSARLADFTGSEYSELEGIALNKMDSQELSVFFTKVADAKGADYALTLLKRADLPQRVDTHLMAHKLGDLLFKQKGANGIQYCTHDFRNACSHSIVIGLFLEKGEKAIAELAPLCKKAPGGKGAYGMCFHGLGHGVLALSDYDLRQAVALCNKLSPGDDKTEARECVGGTIMEMGSGIHDPAIWREQYAKYFTDDPLSPCSSGFIPSYSEQICYTYLTPQLFKRVGADLSAPRDEHFKESFPFCNQIPEAQRANRAACYGGFGKEFVVLARSKDVRNVAAMTTVEMKKIYRWCNLADRHEGTQFCLSQVVNSLFWGGENDRSGAVRFCELATVIGEKTACFNKLTGLIAYYIRDLEYRKDFCDEIPYGYHLNCKRRLL